MDVSEYKAGHYQQGYDYSYFVPSKINHAWVFCDPQLQLLLGETDRALGALSGFLQALPDAADIIPMYIHKEAIHSSRMDGVHANIEDVLVDEKDIDSKQLDPNKHDDWNEINNTISAINNAISRLDISPLNNRLLKEAHRTLMHGVKGQRKLPGEFRISQNLRSSSLKNASFGPPHHSLLVELMSDFEKFVNNDSALPPLIKIAIAHYQFETIHPFLDGNGRLGRLMIILYISRFNLLHHPALYLSDYFEKNQTEYVDRMMAVRQTNDLKGWLIFFLQGVLQTSRHSVQVFKDVIALKSRLESAFLPHFGFRRQASAQALMTHLYQSPVVTIKGVADILQVNANTAAALIRDFERHGILTVLTAKKRNRVYGFSEYIDIFSQKMEFEFNKSHDDTQTDHQTSTQMRTPMDILKEEYFTQTDKNDTQTDILLDTPLDIDIRGNASLNMSVNIQIEAELLDWKVKRLVGKFSGVLSRVEIQSLLELKDAEHLRQQYILPCLKSGYLEMTLSDKPSSKLQKYRLTTTGIQLKTFLGL